MTQLYRVDDGQLVKAEKKPLALEEMIQNWVASDLKLVGLDGIIIGQKVPTAHGKELDILAMDQDGSLVIIELKRDRTPRAVVAQILDYASWVCTLKTAEIHDIAQQKLGRNLSEVYQDYFAQSIPDKLNTTHQMLIVASDFDEASKRIVEYLSEQHDVGINASFFNVFEQDGSEWLTTDYLLDKEVVKERSVQKERGGWTGYHYVTGGDEEYRPWEDMRQHSFITASGGERFSNALNLLSIGDKFFYYQPGNGYLGYGIVNSSRVLASKFKIADGTKLTEILPKPYLTENADDEEKAAYVVGVEWIKTIDRSNGKRFPGIFTYRNPVCKLYKNQQETVGFLIREFDIKEQ